jgi:ribosomal protein S18 acetylase RimI-like enzyme
MNEITQIILNVNTENTRAINLYKKYGFKIKRKIENYYHDDESAYLMCLKV